MKTQCTIEMDDMKIATSFFDDAFGVNPILTIKDGSGNIRKIDSLWIHRNGTFHYEDSGRFCVLTDASKEAIARHFKKQFEEIAKKTEEELPAIRKQTGSWEKHRLTSKFGKVTKELDLEFVERVA